MVLAMCNLWGASFLGEDLREGDESLYAYVCVLNGYGWLWLWKCMNCDGELEFEEVKGKGKGFVFFVFALTVSLFRSSRSVMVVSGMRLGWVLDDRRHWAFFPSCSTGFCENCSQ